MFFVVLTLIMTFLYLFHIEQKRLKFNKQFAHIYSPREYPVIGNSFSVKLKQSSDFINLTKEIGSKELNKLTTFGNTVFVINDPRIVQKVLLSPVFHKRSRSLRFLEMENALFTSEYANWKPIRKPLNVAFTTKRVSQMLPKINKHIDVLCGKIEKFVGKGEFNIFKPISYTQVDLIFDAILGVEFKSDEKLLKSLQVATDTIGKRFLNPIFYPELIYRFTSLYKNLQNTHNLAYEIFQKYTRPEYGVTQENFVNGNSKCSDRNLIDELCEIIKFERLLTFEEIDENIKTIIGAGYETQSHALSFTLLMLALHPDVDNKVFAEIQEHYQDGDFIDHNIVKKCTYLDMVVKEVLRIFPVAPMSMRENMTDVEVDGIGMVPKGTTFLIIMYTLHRMKNIWGPDADKFDPDNFLPEKISKRPTYSYIPFGNGGRNCIGLKYANQNMRMTLIKLLSKYKFTSKIKYDDVQMRYGISLKLKHDYLVKAHLRQKC